MDSKTTDGWRDYSRGMRMIENAWARVALRMLNAFVTLASLAAIGFGVFLVLHAITQS